MPHTHTSTHVYSLSNVQLNTTRDQQSEPASALLSACTRLKDDLIFTRTCTRTHRQTQTHKKYLMSAIFNPDIHKLKQACTCAPCTNAFTGRSRTYAETYNETHTAHLVLVACFKLKNQITSFHSLLTRFLLFDTTGFSS